MSRKLRCYDYVNHPYERVRDELKAHALDLFHDATKVAASRAHSVASGLRVNIGGIEVGTDIAISVKKIVERSGELSVPSTTRVHLEWEAAKMPRLFPFMKAELAIYPLTATETQLDLSGRYEPPLGLLGEAMDAIAGHRIAEASVHRFLTDVAAHLRKTLADR